MVHRDSYSIQSDRRGVIMKNKSKTLALYWPAFSFWVLAAIQLITRRLHRRKARSQANPLIHLAATKNLSRSASVLKSIPPIMIAAWRHAAGQSIHSSDWEALNVDVDHQFLPPARIFVRESVSLLQVTICRMLWSSMPLVRANWSKPTKLLI